MRAIRKVELELRKDREKHLELAAEYGQDFESLEFKRQLSYLKNENLKLREELKRFNKLIGELVESWNTSTLP